MLTVGYSADVDSRLHLLYQHTDLCELGTGYAGSPGGGFELKGNRDMIGGAHRAIQNF